LVRWRGSEASGPGWQRELEKVEAGPFLIALSVLTFTVVAQWTSDNGRRTPDEVMRFLAGLRLGHHEALSALIGSAASFLILGLALACAPP